jgi:hypothetical protein
MSAGQPQPHNDVTDGLGHLTNEVGVILSSISQSSSNLDKTLNGIYTLYGNAIDERVQLLKDLDVILQSNEQAKQALIRAEEEKSNAEELRRQSDEAKRVAEAEKAKLQSQFTQLEQEKNTALAQHQTLQGQHSQLQGQHAQLQTLHSEQILAITTHIDTINQLKLEIKKLEQYLVKLQSQSTAYDCIKLYEQYPLLIKLKRNFDTSNIQINPNDLLNEQSLISFSQFYFNEQIKQLQGIKNSINLIINVYKEKKHIDTKSLDTIDSTN